MKKFAVIFLLVLLSACASSEEELSKRFIDNKDKTVSDIETGLMWASSANDNSVTWAEAGEYCENYSSGGYQDWRMPTQSELAALLKAGLRKNEKTIRINGDLVWADETDDSTAAYCSFRNNGCGWMEQVISISLRALPVRDTDTTMVETASAPTGDSMLESRPQSTEQRLQMLNSLYKQHLITAEEYQRKKTDVLNEL